MTTRQTTSWDIDGAEPQAPAPVRLNTIQALIGARHRVELLARIDSPGTGADLLAACERFVAVCQGIPPNELAEYIGNPTDWSTTK